MSKSDYGNYLKNLFNMRFIKTDFKDLIIISIKKFVTIEDF